VWFAVNIDNKIGAVGFIPRYASDLYPVALLKINEDTGEILRRPDGLCISCKPGIIEILCYKDFIILKNFFCVNTIDLISFIINIIIKIKRRFSITSFP